MALASDTRPQRPARLGAALAAALSAALAIPDARADALGDAAAATVSVQAVEPIAGGRAKIAECSGALIAPDLVLTAGHCLDGAARPSRVAVFAYREGRVVPEPLVAAAIARHPDHVVGWASAAGDPETRQREIAADLALIRLPAAIRGARPIALGAAVPAAGAIAGARSGAIRGARLTSVRASTGAGARVAFASASVAICGGDSGGPAVGEGSALWGVVAAVLKPKAGCGTRIAVTPVDPASPGFVAMRAAVGAK